MTAPSGELGPTQTSTGDTCNPTSTGSRSSSTSGGFKVSTTKTVAVEFSRNGTPPAHLPLKLGTSRLLYQSSVKFLEVIFDRHLTWSEHIQYVADRCRKRLNLMRAMAGSHWGASTTTLLMVFRALIRSVLDYGCIAYESASTTPKKKLYIIQCNTLTHPYRTLPQKTP